MSGLHIIPEMYTQGRGGNCATERRLNPAAAALNRNKSEYLNYISDYISALLYIKCLLAGGQAGRGLPGVLLALIISGGSRGRGGQVGLNLSLKQQGAA